MPTLNKDLVKTRMPNPVSVLPEALQALQALGAATEKGGLPPRTLGLVEIRASQINSCAVCLDGHVRVARRKGETEERLATVAGWRHAPYFDEAERAALALTEAVTRLADRDDPVSDAVWQEAAKHYDQKALAALVLSIAQINYWNRVNVAVAQVAGEWKG